MIQVPPNANVVVMHAPVSFRNGIDGIAAIVRLVLRKEPMDGGFFVFRNRRRDMLRVLYYDGSGFWSCTKRMSKGRFGSWPSGDGTGAWSALLARELQVLLWGGNPGSCGFPDLWRKLT